MWTSRWNTGGSAPGRFTQRAPHRPLLLMATLAVACAVPPGASERGTIPISVRSHNRSSVDVYLLCGDHNAEWLGVSEGKWGRFFEVPATRASCLEGVNFFLVQRNTNRGYWVGPLRLHPRSAIQLTIERYAGLSSARVVANPR